MKLNPWAENKELRQRIASLEADLCTAQRMLNTMHRRDPKTGRILPKGK